MTIKAQIVHVSKGSTLQIPAEFGNDWNDCPAAWQGGYVAGLTNVEEKARPGLFKLSRCSGGYTLTVNSVGNHKIEISALNGSVVYKNQSNGKCQYTLGRTAFKSGVYVVRVCDNNASAMQKVTLW